MNILLILVFACLGFPKNENQLTVTVRDSSDKVVTKPYLTLWRAIEDGEAEPKNTVNGPNGFGYYNPVIWTKPETGLRFTRHGSAKPNDGRHSIKGEDKFSFQGLPAGTYVVSAVTYRGNQRTPDPTPFGFCEPFELTGDNSKEIKIKLLTGHAKLTLKIVDQETEAPIQRIALRLRCESGLPVVHGHGSGNFFERSSKDGIVDFASLPEGKYFVEIIGHRAGTGETTDYLPQRKWHPVELTGDKTVAIPVPPTRLTDAEFSKRNPFAAYGKVTDTEGKPIANASVRVASGIGTLLGGGSTRTDENGNYKLYFGPGMRMKVDPDHAPLGVGSQAAQFTVDKAGFKLKSEDGYIFYLMSDSTPEKFEEGLVELGGSYWSKTDASEVVFAYEPEEINFRMTQSSSEESQD